MQQSKSVVLHAAGHFVIETNPIEPPGPQELQIRIRAVGICGSDIHYYHGFQNGGIIAETPLTLGHESAGEVSAVGSEVAVSGIEGWCPQEGDKVALEVGVPCGTCNRCREGRYNICKLLQFRGSAMSPDAKGTLQSVVNHPAKWCHKLPDNVPLDIGALLEPLAVAIHARNRAGFSLLQRTVLVMGAGSIGLLTAACLKATIGVEKLIIADRDKDRVHFALRNGFADFGYIVANQRVYTQKDKCSRAHDNAQHILKEISGSEQPTAEIDISYECTGDDSCLQTAIYATRPGGKIMLIGIGDAEKTLHLSAAALREIDLIGVFRYANAYPEAISIASDPALQEKIRKIITHRLFGIKSAKQGFQVASLPKDYMGMVVLKVLFDLSDQPGDRPDANDVPDLIGDTVSDSIPDSASMSISQILEQGPLDIIFDDAGSMADELQARI
ncbi:MAG: hypothetical protein M1825_001080 [Sarcosagium campestre]|nr:MAG: hypothetical protein M1825_001080 [Sarcosagium campestre]